MLRCFLSKLYNRDSGTPEECYVCRYTPTEEEILTFLKSLTPESQENLVPPSTVPLVVPARDPKPKRSLRWTKLVVTMPDGERIERSTIRDTFVQVIEKLGVEKVAALGISRGGIPLIADSEYPNCAQRLSGSYYILVDMMTQDKKRDLMKIANGLGIELKVEIVPIER